MIDKRWYISSRAEALCETTYLILVLAKESSMSVNATPVKGCRALHHLVIVCSMGQARSVS